MTRAVKAILIIGVVIFVLSIGYLSGEQMSEYRSHSSNERIDASNSEPTGTILDLSGQQLTELPRLVLNRTDVTVLNISNNQLTELPAGITGMTNLMELNVENNRLKFLHPDIAQLKKLRKLRVDNNRISSLPPELASMIWLDQLDISNNRLPTNEQDKIRSKLTDVQVKS